MKEKDETFEVRQYHVGLLPSPEELVIYEKVYTESILVIKNLQKKGARCE